MHQPLIILGVRAAAAAKGVHQREQRAVVLIEQVLFDAPAAIQALQPHAVGLAEALDKGRFAGEPGIVDHRIAQQQLVVTLVVEQQQVFIVNQDLAAQPPPEPEYPVNRARQAVQIVQRQAGGIELAVGASFAPRPEFNQKPASQTWSATPADYPSAARREKAAVGIPRIAGQRIPESSHSGRLS